VLAILLDVLDTGCEFDLDAGTGLGVLELLRIER